jgi:hypothetical protein
MENVCSDKIIFGIYRVIKLYIKTGTRGSGKK